MSQPVSWATLVREGRERKGWTKRQLAAHVGVSESEIGRIEAGDRGGRLPLVLEIAEALGLDLNQLLPERAP